MSRDHLIGRPQPRGVRRAHLVAKGEDAIDIAQLEFGVTEATLAQVTWLQNDVLADLHRLGVGVAIDDFGTEYSSFEYLRAYRVNHIKIAQSFIRSGVQEPERGATIRAIVSLAREFGIEVIAEGVETREQRDLLVAAGSTDAQGFYFSQPVDADSAYEIRCAEVFLALLDRDYAVLRAFRGDSSLATYLTVVARRVIVPVCQWYIWRPVFIKNGKSASGSSAGGRNSTPTSVAFPSGVGK